MSTRLESDSLIPAPAAGDAIVRRVVSTPVRSATETWATIVMLLSPDPASPARRELNRITGLACAAIASESMRTDPLVFRSRDITIRFYCLHGEEAIMNPAYDAHEFAFSPTDHPWQLSIPCASSDVGWLNRELAAISENVLFRTEGSAPKFGRHLQPAEGPGVAPRRGLASILKMGAFFRS